MAELDRRRLDVCLMNHPGAVGVAGDLRDTWRQVVKEYIKRAGKNRRPSLICACPPCQGMSSARSDRGSHDDADAGSRDARNLLVTIIAKVAKRLKPSLIVVENVPAFLVRKVKHPVHQDPVSGANYLITELSKEYIAFPLVADLCDFGVPQSRTRAFLTFVRRDLRGSAALKRLSRAPYPRPTHVPDEGGLKPINLAQALRSFDLPKLDAATERRAVAKGFGDMHRVPVWDERTYAMVSAIRTGSGGSAWENNACLTCSRVTAGSNDVLCPVCGEPLLRPVIKARNGRYRLIRGFPSSYRRMYPNRPAATVTTASGHVGSDYTLHPTQNRVLSMLECALLQTFPRSFKWGEALKKWGHTNIREMIGEAVPPAFTKIHGDILMGILRGKWVSAPIARSDERCLKAWKKLFEASKQIDRLDLKASTRRSVPPISPRSKQPIGKSRKRSRTPLADSNLRQEAP